MKLIVLTLILLGVFFQCAYTQQEEYNQNVYNKIKEMEKTEFGKTVIDTIAVQLQTQGPAEDLIDLLQKIEDNIRQEQDEDDAFIEELQQKCDENLAKLEADIEKAKERSAQLQAELEEKIPIRDQKVEQLAQKNEAKTMVENKIVEIDAKKELKDQEWAEEQQQHDDAAAVIQRAKQIIEENVQSFLQKGSPIMAQVSSSVRNSMKKQSQFKRKSWSSFFNLLAQVTDDIGIQADQSQVQRIIELCEAILDKIAESREIERKDYQFWVEEYEQARDGLTTKLENLINVINQLEAEIAALNKRITDAQYEKGEQDKRAEQKQQQHDEKLQYCDDENKAYFDRRQNRDDERSIVSQTIGLLQGNLRTFRKYINDRISQ